MFYKKASRCVYLEETPMHEPLHKKSNINLKINFMKIILILTQKKNHILQEKDHLTEACHIPKYLESKKKEKTLKFMCTTT